MIYVPGTGNPNARLVVVGEAPTAREEELLQPFAGASGAIVDQCLLRAGTSRSEVYLTNVVKVRPPNNDITLLKNIGVKIEDFEHDLWKEIEDISPNAILAFGNVALKALTGFTGITNYRGSILANRRTATPKVVASIHPASLFKVEDGKMKSYRDRAFIQMDVKRAVEQSLFKEFRLPSRNLYYAKSSLDLHRFIERNKGKQELVYDIETYKAIPMCISFAFSRHEAISIPLFNLLSPRNEEGTPVREVSEMWRMVQYLLSDSQYKLIGHNLKFDQGRLESLGFQVNWPYFDTNLAFHVMYSELPKKLQFVSSILTEEPYYKDDLEEYNPKKDKLIKRLIYNARDSAVTFEVYEKEKAELKEMGMLDWYFENQHKLHKFYYNLEKRGILTNPIEQKRLTKKYERYNHWIDRIIEKELGFSLNVNSPKQVGAALYGFLKCPMRKGVDEETLEMLMLNAVKDERRKGIISNILKGRKSRKTLYTYVRAIPDSNRRMHTTVNICGAESGRTSNSKPKQPVVAEPEGLAFQTITKHGDVGADLRRMYVPSPGKVLIECDGGQAEDRVVCNLANDYDGLAILDKKNFIYNSHGIKDDRHTLTTMMVLSLSFDSVTDDLRQIGKKTRHAGNYKMGKRRLAQMAQISEWKAGKCLTEFHTTNPKISGIFWEEIIQALHDNGQVLYSPHGRRRMFFDRWGEDMFKEAFSYIPQATVSDHTKFAAIRIEEKAPWIEMLMESHDSFLAEVPIEQLDEAAMIMREEYEVPIDFSRCSIVRPPIVIPCEIQVGYENWKDMKKYKFAA